MSRKRTPKFDQDYISSLAGDLTAPAEEHAPTVSADDSEIADAIAPLIDDTQIPGVIVPTKATDQFRVGLELIHHYDNNPRIATHNPDAIQSLAWSIFTTGLINPITITKRPHEAHFIVAKGGNGRLRALNHIVEHYDNLVSQLPEGTSPRPLTDFSRPTTRFEPYTSEIAIFEAHLDENLEREDTLWADTAHALITLKAMTEQVVGKVLSQREFGKSLEDSGRFKKIRSLETISRASFTMSHLGPVINTFPRALAHTNNSLVLLRQTHRDCMILMSTYYNADSRDPFDTLCLEWTNQFVNQTPPPSTEPNLFAAELSAHWIAETEKSIGLDESTAITVWTNHRANRPGGTAFRHADWNSLLVPTETTLTEPTTQQPHTEPESTATSGSTSQDHSATVEATENNLDSDETAGNGATAHAVRQRVTRIERLHQLRTSMHQWRQVHANTTLPQPVLDLVEHIANEDEHPLLTFLSSAHQDAATQSLARELITFMRVLVAHGTESADSDTAPTDDPPSE